MNKNLISLPRARILTLVNKKPKTIAELQRELKIGRTTLYHHLEELKKSKLIIEKKEIRKQGKPVFISTNKANPLTEKTLNMMRAFLDFLSIK